MPSIKFDITGDNKQLVASLQQAQLVIGRTIDQLGQEGQRIDKTFEDAGRTVDEASNKIDRAGSSIEGSLKKIGAGIGAYFAAEKVKDFIGEVINVRKEFQSLEVSFSTLLGSAEKGKQIFKEITDYATSTPMLEKDLAKGAQTLLGFGIDEGSVMTYLKELGDISMGDSEKFQSLTLAFAQIQASGKLMGQDLNQLINAGFNPLQEISKQTGKSIGELKDDMSKGAISAEMVADAFKSATSEGGKFHGMLEAQSKTLAGSISNLEGALQKLFNEIGEEGEGVAVNIIDGLTSGANALSNSLKEVSSAMTYCLGAFGGYKAACMLVSASNSIAAASALGYSLKTQMLRKEVTLMNAAQALLNKTMLLNPYVLAGVAAGALAVAVFKIATADDAATLAQKNFNSELEEAKKKQEEYKQQIEETISTATDENKSTADRKDAIEILAKAYPTIIAKYIDEEGHLTNILQLKREIAAIDGKRNLGDLRQQSHTYQRYADVLQKYINNGQSKKGMSTDERYLLKSAVQLYNQDNPWSKNIFSTYSDYQTYFQTKSRSAANQYGKSMGANSVAGTTDKIANMNKQQLQSSKKYWNSIVKQLTDKGKNEAYINGYGTITKDQANLILAQIDAGLKPKKTSTGGTSGKSTSTSNKTTADTAKKELEEREKLNKELAELEQENVDNDIKINKQGSAQKLADIDNEYKKRVAKLEEQKADWIKRNKESNMSGLLTEGTNAGLTQEQAKAYDDAVKLAATDRAKQYKEEIEQETQYMLDYLKEYGTMQEQRYAIAKEYDDKIAKLKAGGANEWQIKTAQRQKESAMSNNYEQDLLSRIDFATAFDDFGAAFREPLEQIRAEIEAYTKTSSFKNKDVKEQQSIIEALNKVEEKLGGEISGLNFKQVGKDMNAYNAALVKLNNVTVAQSVAFERLQQAQDDYNKALATGNKAEIESAKTKLTQAQMSYNATTNSVQGVTQMVNDTKANLTDSEKSLVKGLDSVQKMAQGLASGSASQLWNAMPTEITNKAADAISKALGGKSDIWSMIISTILSLLDTLKQGIGTLVNGIITSVGDAIQGILDEIGSGKFFAQIGEAIYNLITSIVNGVFDLFSGGQFSKINWVGSNAEDVAEITEDNTKAIEANTDRIDALKEAIDKQTGTQAVATSVSAIQAQQDTNKRVMETLDAQMGYHGDHHSNNYYADSDYVAKLYNDTVQNAINAGEEMQKSISGLNDIYTMTPEQIAAIKTYMPALWEYLTTVGKYDKSEYWEDVVDQAGKLEEITEQVKENLTGMTFDSLKDGFKSALMDMDSTVDDFADDLTEKMTDAFLNIKLGEEGGLYDKLEQWYNNYYDKLKDGDLTEQEKADAQKEYQELVQEGIETRDKIAALTGYDSTSASQKATAEGIQSITADQADQLVGRITAMQIAVEQSKDTTSIMSAQITNGVNQLLALSTGMTSANKSLGDILLQMQTANGYLYDIADRNKKMYNEWTEKLDTINATIKAQA